MNIKSVLQGYWVRSKSNDRNFSLFKNIAFHFKGDEIEIIGDLDTGYQFNGSYSLKDNSELTVIETQVEIFHIKLEKDKITLIDIELDHDECDKIVRVSEDKYLEYKDFIKHDYLEWSKIEEYKKTDEYKSKEVLFAKKLNSLLEEVTKQNLSNQDYVKKFKELQISIFGKDKNFWPS